MRIYTLKMLIALLMTAKAVIILFTAFLMPLLMVPVVEGGEDKESDEIKWQEEKSPHVTRPEFGPDFAAWHAARQLHLDDEFEKALPAYNELIDRFPDTVYAEGARFYQAECLVALDRTDQAETMLTEFIDDNPHGLWRGEALYRLGKISLVRDWDKRQARQYFEQVVEWIKKAPHQERDVKLYVVPEKARKITAPPPKPLKMKNRRLLSPDVKPEMVINRRTADWYLDRLQWRALYYLGLFEFVEADYKAARKRWTEAFKLSKQRQEQHASRIASFHRRLMNACRGELFVAERSEMKAFSRGSEERLKLMLGDFYALWLQWEKAENLYREIISSLSTDKNQKACAIRCLATAKNFQGEISKAGKLYHKLVENYADTISAQPAYYFLAMKTGLKLEKKIQYLQKSYTLNKNTDLGKKALYQIGYIAYYKGHPDKAKKAFRSYVERYPDHRFVHIAEDKLKIIEKYGGYRGKPENQKKDNTSDEEN